MTATALMKSNHVYRRFPNYIEAIQTLLQKDATFREICADDEEICTWLDNYRRSQDRPSEECNHAREIIRDLEDEIENWLRGAGFCMP